jgi:hypothetical protein
MFSCLRSIVVVCAIANSSAVCDGQTVVRESFQSRPGGDFLTLPVQIAGTKYTFLLDTGSQVTIVDTRLRRLLKKAGPEKSLSDGNKSTSKYTYTLPQGAKIGRSISIEKIPFVLCHDFSAVRDAFGVDFDGLIGCDCLTDKRLEIDFDLGLVRFFDQIDDESHGLGAEVRLQTNQHGLPAIPIALGPGRAVPFVIDTGAIGIHIQLAKSRYQFLEFVNELRNEGTTVIQSVHGQTKEHTGIVSSASIGTFRFRQLKVETGPFDFVGLDFLSRFAITLDFPSRQAFLRPSKRHREGPDCNLIGAKLRRVNDAFPVRDVEENSLAALAGLQVGDVITQVNGVAASQISLIEMRHICARKNSQIKMRATRHGELNDIPLIVSIPKSLK